MDAEIDELLSALVGFDTSINPSTGQYPGPQCRDFLTEYSEKWGYEILELTLCQLNDHPIYPLLVCKRGKVSGPIVLFLGHIDVVPVTEDELEKWKSNPFEAHIVDGKLYGRGSSDMKSGVASFFAAFNEVEIEKGTIVIALSGDEETGGFASMPTIIEALKHNELMPDYVINAEPSAKPYIVTQRRGGTWLKFTFPLNYRKIRGKRAEISFESFQGNGSETLHSAQFVLGSDSHAMINAAKFCVDKHVIDIESSSVKTNSVPRSVNVEFIDDGDDELEFSPSLTIAMNALASIGSLNWPILRSKFGIAVNPNMIQYDLEASEFSLFFDIRAMLESVDSHITLQETLSEHFRAYGLDSKSEILVSIDPVNVDPASFLPSKLKEIAEKMEMKIYAVGEKLGGASDTRYFTSLGIPGVELGPHGANEHGTNEYTDLASVKQLASIFRELFYELTR